MTDSQCYQLAAHFIASVPELNDTLDAEQHRWELAAHIQAKIEEWIRNEMPQSP